MSKTLETKKKILELLENKKMTVTELSRELKLSKATVSQHIDELARIKAVEKVDTEYYKKLKYYKAVPNYSAMFAKVIGVIIILGVIAYAVFFYPSNTAYPSITSQNNATNATTTYFPNNTISTNVIATPGPISSTSACMFLNYHINGTITNTSGFSTYTLNHTVANTTLNITDYVISRGALGTLVLTENITQTLSEPSGFNSTRTHRYLLRYNNSIIGVYPGVNLTFNPKTFVAANGSINAIAHVNIAPNATYGTYWINIDGPCGGGIGPALLTIGNKPYNGTISEPVNIFG